MNQKMRNDIKEARVTALKITRLIASNNSLLTSDELDTIYSAQVKAYMRGYKNAIQNVQKEFSDE